MDPGTCKTLPQPFHSFPCCLHGSFKDRWFWQQGTASHRLSRYQSALGLELAPVKPSFSGGSVSQGATGMPQVSGTLQAVRDWGAVATSYTCTVPGRGSGLSIRKLWQSPWGMHAGPSTL